MIITPDFFRSRACREEVERFLAQERELGRDDLILPVYYVSTPELEDPSRRAADELARVLASRQYADWRELRFEPFNSPMVRRAIAQLATRMRDTFWRIPPDKPAGHSEPRSSVTPPTEGTRPVTPAKATARAEQPHQIVPHHGKDSTRASAVIETKGSEGTETPDRDLRLVPDRTASRPKLKALLLIGSGRRTSVMSVRIVYYISFVWAAAWAATGISETISHFSTGYLIGAILLILILTVPISWALYKLATRLDRRA